MMNIRLIFRSLSVVLLAAAAAVIPGCSSGTSFFRVEQYAEGFTFPLFVTSPPGDARRLFVVEKGGKIWIVSGCMPLPESFLDLNALVSSGGEQGLLGIAFHPDYNDSGFFYVDYTDQNGDGPAPYTVPSTNPFFGLPGQREEIWAYGLRNPWRFSFDRATGDLYLGGVGQDALEEIDYQPASSSGGENYGWDAAEGSACLGGSGTYGLNLAFSAPIYEYNRNEGRSVTGGYVYRGGAVDGEIYKIVPL